MVQASEPSAPHRPRGAWQGGLDHAADAHGVELIWCMATPADIFPTTLVRVAVRTSDDYRFIGDPALRGRGS